MILRIYSSHQIINFKGHKYRCVIDYNKLHDFDFYLSNTSWIFYGVFTLVRKLGLVIGTSIWRFEKSFCFWTP